MGEFGADRFEALATEAGRREVGERTPLEHLVYEIQPASCCHIRHDDGISGIRQGLPTANSANGPSLDGYHLRIVGMSGIMSGTPTERG